MTNNYPCIVWHYLVTEEGGWTFGHSQDVEFSGVGELAQRGRVEVFMRLTLRLLRLGWESWKSL